MLIAINENKKRSILERRTKGTEDTKKSLNKVNSDRGVSNASESNTLFIFPPVYCDENEQNDKREISDDENDATQTNKQTKTSHMHT